VITLVAAPPFATIQDLGRTGYRAEAVPPGGALDRAALVAGNRLVGNTPDAAAVEWARGPGEVRFERPTIFALTGAEPDGLLGARRAPGWTTLAATAGETLRVGDFARGAWLYLCVRGGIDVPRVLGSRSTLLAARLGGLEGRLLRNGDALAVGQVSIDAPPPGTTLPRATGYAWDDPEAVVPLLAGPARRARLVVREPDGLPA
jgi:allophanate hydrolase subunit 2